MTGSKAPKNPKTTTFYGDPHSSRATQIHVMRALRFHATASAMHSMPRWGLQFMSNLVL